jgi:hypothetical protein
MFDRVTPSACGTAQSAMGPFYCPADQKIYLDTSFFRDMQRKFGGGGDFAYAYVIAHEMGHHIEHLMGILGRVQQAQRAIVEAKLRIVGKKGAASSTVSRSMVSAPAEFTPFTPASTWLFQFWYRNPAAGYPNFNLSDALRVQFAP